MSDAPPLRVRDVSVDADLPGPHLLVQNATDEAHTLSVTLLCDGRVRTATIELPARAGRSVEVPARSGLATGEVHADGGVARLTFDPDRSTPLFSVRDGSVLVAPN